MDTTTNNIHLHIFYGIACVGKSTMALRFAHDHPSIRTIISTDYIREVQRMYVQQADGPLEKVTHTAWELGGRKRTTDTIVQGFIQHVEAVTPALLAIARKLSKDGFDAIVEGVHCYSQVLEQLQHIAGLAVVPQLLIVSSESRLVEHIQRKEEERYHTSEVKAWKRHAPILMTIQDFLVQDAIQQQNIQIICID